MIRQGLGAAWAAAALLLAGCGQSAATSDSAPPPPVTVAHPLFTESATAIELTGTVSASTSVDLVPQASGTVTAKNFTDGSFVRKGQMLFRIAPEPYEAQVALATAAEAQARDQYEMQERLWADDATSRNNLNNARHALEQATANTRLARINLSYTAVRAPFSGWIGSSSVDVGTFVSAGTARLATIQRLNPVYVEFSLGERQVLQILESLRARGQTITSVGRGYPVAIGLLDQPDFGYNGTLDFADRQIDASTGSLRARAIVPNGGQTDLLPGMFARVRIELNASQAEPRMELPAAAIQSDPLGDYVLVVDGEQIVQRRDIETGADAGRNRIVLSGLSADDWVVINGLANVRLGEQATVTKSTLPVPDGLR